MKKFYYGHQKRRSLQTILSPERPQAEPIMSSDQQQQSNEEQGKNTEENFTQADENSRKFQSHLRSLRSRSIQGLEKTFGSFQSIPEHCNKVSNTNSQSSNHFLKLSDINDSTDDNFNKKYSDKSKIQDDVLCSPEDVPKVVSRPAELLRVQFVKGAGRPSLGFTIAGGADSPKGSMGIYVKTVLAGGQAEKQGCLRTGDEILSVNTVPLSGLTRTQATAVFAKVRTGTVTLRVLRRGTAGPLGEKSTSNRCPGCDQSQPGVGFNPNNTNAFSKSGLFVASSPSPSSSSSSSSTDHNHLYRLNTDTYLIDTDTEMTDVSPNELKKSATYIIDSKNAFTNFAHHFPSARGRSGVSGGEVSDLDSDDFDMGDLEVPPKEETEIDGNGGSCGNGSGNGYFKRVKRLYSAITTNF